MDFPNQDLTATVSFGNSSLVDDKGNGKGKTNANQGSAAAKGDAANASGSGVSSLCGTLEFSWTGSDLSELPDTPLLSSVFDGLASGYTALVEKAKEALGIDLPLQHTLVDINGDGLPDRVVTKTTGVFVRYNLGYSFTEAAVKLSDGGFESRESFGSSISLGFAAPDGSYSVGGSINTNLDLSRYSWRDVNGDGIIDLDINMDGVVDCADITWFSASPNDWNLDGEAPDDDRVQLLDVLAASRAVVDGDGIVDITDLQALLGSWGPCPPAGDCVTDFDCDGIVGIVDMLVLLSLWGRSG